MRLVALALTFSTAAAACPPGQAMTFAREEDGAVFKPEQYGAREERLPAWFVYRGTLKGRTLYLATGNMPGSTALGTSGARLPAAGIRWERALEPLDDGSFVGGIYEGPLKGVWRVKCEQRG